MQEHNRGWRWNVTMSVLCSGGAFESILPSARASDKDLVAPFSLAGATVDGVNARFHHGHNMHTNKQRDNAANLILYEYTGTQFLRFS